MITRKLRGSTVVILTGPHRQTSRCLDIEWNSASGVLAIMPKISEISVEKQMERFSSRENFPVKVVDLHFDPLVRSSDQNLPFHFKKFSFSAEKLSKFGSKRNRKLRSGWKLWFNRTMSFHFLLVSGQPGRSRARLSTRKARARARAAKPKEWGLEALRKKDDRSRSRLGLTGRFGKIHKMESTPGVWCVSCSSNFKSS